MSRDFIEEDSCKEFDYVTYGRQFDSYRWFKPILTMVLFMIFLIIFACLLAIAVGAYDFIRTGGDLQGYLDRYRNISYDNMNVHDLTGSLINFGTLALMIPSLALARGIVQDRSFSSYTSSRGGWSHTVFLKSFMLALVICGGFLYLQHFIISEPGAYNNQFTKSALIALFLLCPLQCLAEEYIFRGLICQTLGSWFRVPIIAIVLSSAGFAALHPYDLKGQIAIFAVGAGYALCAWFGHGLEIPAAFHIVNNVLVFLGEGLGYSKITTATTNTEFIIDILTPICFTTAVFFISRKTDWFDRIKYDDAGDWNDIMDEKYRMKMAKKAAKKEKREAKREARKNA